MSEVDPSNTTPELTQERVLSRRAASKGKKAVAKKNAILQKLAVEYVPIEQLHANDYNPNRQSDHDFELLLRSIEEDGFTQPILVNQDLVIVDGEHRWLAAKSLGMATIPIVKVNMTVEQARISTIRHNRAHGSHDVELEAEVLRDLQALGALDWAADSLMLDDVELNRLLSDIAAPDAMSNAEYAQAWVPDSIGQEEADLIRQGSDQLTEASNSRGADGSDAIYAMTADAVAAQRRREQAILHAKSAQDKVLAAKDGQVFRLALTISGKEAKVVKRVLGPRPAERLVELCQEADHAGRQT